MSDWFFRPKQPGEKIREPIHGEFFSMDAISEPGMSLVREGIQNSLDQSINSGPVIVRIYLSGQSDSLKFSEIEPLFDNAWKHFNAEGNGLHPYQKPAKGEKCDYLVFEDFLTTGLEGDPEVAFKPKEGGKNNFYHFFRAEGQTDKTGSELGSWGVGKHVFFRASRISTAFGLTVRSSDRHRLLMGNAILKSHYVDDVYYQDGYFGVPPDEDNKLVLPIQDEKLLDLFTNIFGLQRAKDDPGLSIVVPWPDNDITEKAIIKAVLSDYFFPILNGQLQVFVETPSIKSILDSSNLISEIQKLDKDITSDLIPLVKLANWAYKINEEERITINNPDANEAWKWTKSLFSDELLDRLKEDYNQGKYISIRIPVKVRIKDGDKLDSFFDVFLVRDNSEHIGRPTFIREGIIISNVNAPRTRGVRSIVLAHDEPIAKFLRKSENPSHTEWQHSHLKDEYERGYKTDLDFVKRSVNEIVKIISEAEEEDDPALLLDFFSIPKDFIEEEPQSKGNDEASESDKKTHGSPVPDPDPESKVKSFKIEKISGGFSILPSKNGRAPDFLDIQVAYDTRRGQPLSKYSEIDFEIGKNTIKFEPSSSNVKIIESKNNKVSIKIINDDFEFHLTGFDTNRQLYVKASPSGDNSNGGT